MELELNSLDWNVNELEHELELEDMKRTNIGGYLLKKTYTYFKELAKGDQRKAYTDHKKMRMLE